MDIASLVFDCLAGLILLISVGIAVLRGFIREVLTIFGVIGGALASYFIGPLLSPVFNGWLVGDVTDDEIPKLFGIVPYDMLADFLAYGLIFVFVVIVLSLVSHALSGWAKALGLGVLDRALGALFGLVRAVIIVGIIYMPFYMLADEKDRAEWFGQAYSFKAVERITGQMQTLMPESVEDEVEEQKEKGKDSIADKLRKEVEQKFQEVTGDVKEEAAKVKDGTTDTQEEVMPTPPANPSGYKDTDREHLDQLFEQGIDSKTGDTVND